jgi:hypothetical protein
MAGTFCEKPILNSPYAEPARHHALDKDGQPADEPPRAGRRRSDDGSIDIGKTVTDPDTGNRAEIDFFRVKEYREVWSYECKAQQPSEIVSRDAIEHWLTDRVPLMHRALSREQRFQECAFHYEYGTFCTGCPRSSRTSGRKYEEIAIGWKNGGAVRAYVAKVRPKAVANKFDQHFFQDLSQFSTNGIRGSLNCRNLRKSIWNLLMDRSESVAQLHWSPIDPGDLRRL